MSSIEERLVQDIEAVAGGVVVTDSDLRDARAAFDERIERQKQRNRRLGVIVAAAAAALVLVLGVVAFRALNGDDLSAPPAGPGPSTPDQYQDFLVGRSPTADDARGVWRLSNDALLRFSSPNGISIDQNGRMFDVPDVRGTYEITGGQITVSVTGGLSGCAGQKLVLRASMPEQDVLRVVPTQTGSCSLGLPQTWTLERVAATGPFLGMLDAYSSASDWQSLPAGTSLYGSWLAEGGGYFLELAHNGTYYVADGSAEAIDQGQWSRNGSTLTLTSSSQSTACNGGDRLVLRNVKVLSPGTLVLRSTVQENGCNAPWAGKGWILVPYPGS